MHTTDTARIQDLGTSIRGRDPTTRYDFFRTVISVASFTGLNCGGYGFFFGSVVYVAVTYDSQTRGVECAYERVIRLHMTLLGRA